jgi:hypothetical protein
MKIPTKKDWAKETFGNFPVICLIIGVAMLVLSVPLFFSQFWKIGFILFIVSWFPLGIYATFKVFEAGI